MKYVFIINPTSGNGNGRKVADKIKKVCLKKHYNFIMHYTSAPGDATRLAKKYKREENVIFGVGGDGTIHEVLNGIVGTKNMLGVVPAGSGNDFYKTLSKYDELLLTSDIGKINRLYFLNVAAIGIDAEVGTNAEKMKGKVPPSQIYNASIIYTFIKYRNKKIEYELKGKKDLKTFTMLTVCNGQFYGGGYHIAPQARLNDGVFDIYFVKKVSKFKIPSLLFKLKNGAHEEAKEITRETTNKIKIKLSKKTICNVDGETLIDNKYNFKIIKNAIIIYNNKELISSFIE